MRDVFAAIGFVAVGGVIMYFGFYLVGKWIGHTKRKQKLAHYTTEGRVVRWQDLSTQEGSGMLLVDMNATEAEWEHWWVPCEREDPDSEVLSSWYSDNKYCVVGCPSKKELLKIAKQRDHPIRVLFVSVGTKNFIS